jgi:uncharacterized protein
MQWIYVGATVALLTVSNIFMTFAWYGHLKYKHVVLWQAILLSWLIAFAEYCFQVPANRVGYFNAGLKAAHLKTIQEVITLTVFCGFSVLYLKEGLRWNYIVGFALVVLAVFFVFYFGPSKSALERETSGSMAPSTVVYQNEPANGIAPTSDPLAPVLVRNTSANPQSVGEPQVDESVSR